MTEMVYILRFELVALISDTVLDVIILTANCITNTQYFKL